MQRKTTARLSPAVFLFSPSPCAIPSKPAQALRIAPLPTPMPKKTRGSGRPASHRALADATHRSDSLTAASKDVWIKGAARQTQNPSPCAILPVETGIATECRPCPPMNDPCRASDPGSACPEPAFIAKPLANNAPCQDHRKRRLCNCRRMPAMRERAGFLAWRLFLSSLKSIADQCHIRIANLVTIDIYAIHACRLGFRATGEQHNGVGAILLALQPKHPSLRKIDDHFN